VTGHSSKYDPVHMAIMELKGKLDTLIQVNQLREQAQNLELKQMRDDSARWQQDHEARLRLLEGRIPGSMEQRMLNLESRKYVEPRTVWTATALLVTFGSLIVAIINLATK
jgi:hypothetical protein